MKFDIIVTGFGPSGYVAALRSARAALCSMPPSWSASTLAESDSIGLYSHKGASARGGNLEATQEELIQTVVPHPTLSEMIRGGRQRLGHSQIALGICGDFSEWGRAGTLLTRRRRGASK
jgi:hypothetical protein